MNKLKAIHVTKWNTGSVEKLTGLKSPHILDRVVVVMEKTMGHTLVEVCQRWAFDSKYVFSTKPDPHALTPIEAI